MRAAFDALLDRAYLEQWAGRLGVSDLLGNVES
jgi:hypothetical protein